MIVSAGLLLGAVAAWGIIESVTLAALITVIEIGGLLVVIGVGASELPSIAERWREFLPSANSGSWSSLVVAATLAFYAFIGFEDMVDVAEEVKDVRHTMPTAILLTLAFATLLYMTLMVSALLALPPQVLAASDAPIATLYAAHTDSQPVFIGLIAMFAIINGALVQIVMASRVLYGLGSRRQLPAILSRVDARTKTPLIATAIVTIALVALALFGRLASLATATAVIMLSVFTAINLALWRIKGHKSTTPPVLSIPRWMPMVGALLSGGLVIRELLSRL